MDHEGARESDALAHAAGQLARIGRLEPVEADQVDGGQRALADLRPRQVLRFQAERHVLEHGEPGKQREALEHHRDAARRSDDRVPEILHLARARLRETGDQAQERRLARSRAAEQPHDLSFAQLEVHAVEHQELLAIGLRKRLAHLAALEQWAVDHDVRPVRSSDICARRSNTRAARTAG
jgi:hypothetical protein